MPPKCSRIDYYKLIDVQAGAPRGTVAPLRGPNTIFAIETTGL
jgi:hypothetical protein